MSRARRSGERAGARSADDPALIDLLETVREVRTTLAIDLAAAAGALEENQRAVARDIIAATSDELSLVQDNHQDRSDELAARRRARRTRALLALPAVPLVGALAMTTAAALNGSSKPAHHVVASSPSPAPHTAASTALRRLEHVVNQHAQAAQVIGAADDLHKQLTRMIATSTNNPAQLHVVQQLLTLEQHVLEGSKVPGTQLALAASRAIAELLESRPAHSQPKRSFSSHTTPTNAPTTRSTPAAKPAQTHVQRAPQPHQSASTSHATPTPKPTNQLFGDGFFNWP
ncbi:MAG TPA: hypothetical protein VHD81_10550 [Mycobacteriales bacterium]|nr:hypothetical protein [Mycobacteriales bacterium]